MAPEVMTPICLPHIPELWLHIIQNEYKSNEYIPKYSLLLFYAELESIKTRHTVSIQSDWYFLKRVTPLYDRSTLCTSDVPRVKSEIDVDSIIRERATFRHE